MKQIKGVYWRDRFSKMRQSLPYFDEHFSFLSSPAGFSMDFEMEMFYQIYRVDRRRDRYSIFNNFWAIDIDKDIKEF